MKKIIAPIFIFALCLASFGQTPVMFPLQQMFGGAVYTETFTATAAQDWLTDGTNAYIGTSYTITPSGGTNPIVVMTPNTYVVQFPDAKFPWRIKVPNTTNLQNAILLSTGPLPTFLFTPFPGLNNVTATNVNLSGSFSGTFNAAGGNVVTNRGNQGIGYFDSINQFTGTGGPAIDVVDGIFNGAWSFANPLTVNGGNVVIDGQRYIYDFAHRAVLDTGVEGGINGIDRRIFFDSFGGFALDINGDTATASIYGLQVSTNSIAFPITGNDSTIAANGTVRVRMESATGTMDLNDTNGNNVIAITTQGTQFGNGLGGGSGAMVLTNGTYVGKFAGDGSGLTNLPAGGLTGVVTNQINSISGVITNGTVVWYALKTNAAPAIAAASGSICTTTNGQLYVRSNSVWMLK